MNYAKKLPFYLVISLLGLTPTLSQASLPQNINQYFRQIHGKGKQVSIEIKTPIERWPTCENPQLNPPVGGRNMGNVSLPIAYQTLHQFHHE